MSRIIHKALKSHPEIGSDFEEVLFNLHRFLKPATLWILDLVAECLLLKWLDYEMRIIPEKNALCQNA